MREKPKKISIGEYALRSCGYIFVSEENVAINQSLRQSIYKYARYLDDERTGVDSTVVFDTSQKSIDVWNSYGSTSFLSIDEICAIYTRAKELGYQVSRNIFGLSGNKECSSIAKPDKS